MGFTGGNAWYIFFADYDYVIRNIIFFISGISLILKEQYLFQYRKLNFNYGAICENEVL